MSVVKAALIHIRLVVAIGITWVIFSIPLAIWQQEPDWFGASGAVMVVCGVVLAARRLIRLGYTEIVREQFEIDYGHIIPTPEEIEAARQVELDMNAYRCSLWLLVGGTIIWAYGALLLAAAFGMVGFAWML